ncbi:tRNA 2-thiouridine(34) synthase MnmA [bacterium]|jgi:tRNA-specific 2-thiouridylase|nr:tRNA 2-thiouridine(34) synthase MnmA [bacterium]MDG1175688.1 tRNA 2-thiouridine(34) synthase MnmA [Flavobacteriales bacterium]
MSKTVVVGLSGGVDSSVAAYLLKEQGYNVIALFMKNWHDETVVINNECPWIDDSNDALAIAEQLGIPFQTLDLSAEYKERIVDYMFAEYQAGRTPNPDVLCNREIKFDVFLNAALKLGADYVATGHYCRKGTEEIEGTEIHKLIGGKDDNKDQSYFLCQLNQFQLSKALFPIGELQKSEVRDIARAQKLVTAEKKDSQGLCFVGKIKLPDFLQQKLQPKKGRIIEVPEDFPAYAEYQTKTEIEELATPFSYQRTDGKDKGEHQGAHYFTTGQRKGLGVGGTEFPLFVIATDVKENIVYVGQGTDHPGLYRKALKVSQDEIHWIREDLRLKAGESLTCDVRIRYRQDLETATVFQTETDLFIQFENPQRGITSGQFAAWYFNEELLGSGVIY